MLEHFARLTIIAHRGASAYAPENTLAAFNLAIQQNADAIELDAKLSSDGHVVVIHDQTVDRTTTGSGSVGELSLSYLRSLDAGSHFDSAFQNERIPTLEQVFLTVGNEIFINVELTNYASPGDQLPDKVADLVGKHKLEQSILCSSFNPIALRRFNRLIPAVPIGLLALPGLKGALARSRLGRFIMPYQSLHPELGDISTNLVDRIHRSGNYIYAYTVNHARDMRRMLDYQIDGFFTDDVLLARQIIES